MERARVRCSRDVLTSWRLWFFPFRFIGTVAVAAAERPELADVEKSESGEVKTATTAALEMRDKTVLQPSIGNL
jgi:hypothetical protein